MSNIEVIKSLLQNRKNDCHNILYEYIEVLSKDKDYVVKATKSDISSITDIVKKVLGIVDDIHDKYYEGKIREALDIARRLLVDDFYIEIPKDTALYRARGCDSGFLFPKEEMFHIPFEKRYLVGNQRYSMSGMPCMYLGGSSYICWEELGRPDYNKCNYACFKNNETIYVYDFCVPSEIKSLADVKRTALILACSIPADPKHVFKEQYILPQCIFQAMIDKHYNEGECFAEDQIFGIRYLSTHFLLGETDLYRINTNDSTQVHRMVNYVFPSLSNSTAGFSKPLLRAFNYSDTTSIMHESIKNPLFYVSAEEDEYKDSLFGAMDDVLRESVGLNRIRKETQIIVTG